jgi:hypothetical protein
MIPQFMTEILDILQMWIQKAHQLDHYLRIALPLFPVLQRQKIFYHLLDMPAIFTIDQVIPGRIIFHTLNLR